MDSEHENTDLAEQYKEKMVRELEKFVQVYNRLAGTDYLLDLDRGEYDVFLRILGHYISEIYTSDKWMDSRLELSDDIHIDFVHFRGTPFESSVASFLTQLRHAFDDSLDHEVDEYLNETDAFTEEEKSVCRYFYSKVTDLHRAMKKNMFDRENLANAVESPESISKYKEVLCDYNAYMFTVARQPRLTAIITRFDEQIRRMAREKRQVDVRFDA